MPPSPTAATQAASPVPRNHMASVAREIEQLRRDLKRVTQERDEAAKERDMLLGVYLKFANSMKRALHGVDDSTTEVANDVD